MRMMSEEVKARLERAIVRLEPMTRCTCCCCGMSVLRAEAISASGLARLLMAVGITEIASTDVLCKACNAEIYR